MIKVIDDKVVQIGLPRSSINRNGETIINYHLQSEAELKKEGWLPLEDIEPEYDKDTQYLVQDGYEVLEDKVIKKYRIEEIPEREEPRDLEVEIEELRQIIDILLGDEGNE